MQICVLIYTCLSNSFLFNFRKDANFNDKDFDSHSWKILENISKENHDQVVRDLTK